MEEYLRLGFEGLIFGRAYFVGGIIIGILLCVANFSLRTEQAYLFGASLGYLSAVCEPASPFLLANRSSHPPPRYSHETPNK